MEALLEHCTANDAGGAGENNFHCDDLEGDDYELITDAKLRNKQIYIRKQSIIIQYHPQHEFGMACNLKTFQIQIKRLRMRHRMCDP